MTEESLFAAALENPTPAQQTAFLEGACAGDAELRRRVEALLKAHHQAGNFFKPLVAAPAATEHYVPRAGAGLPPPSPKAKPPISVPRAARARSKAPDFDALRGRDDFKKLVVKLETRNKADAPKERDARSK
jgi:hypothetical protein